MPSFAYTGRDSTGERVSGSIDVGSREMAASMLLGRGIVPLSIESSASQAAGKSGRSFGGDRPLTMEELQIFSRP